MSVNDILGILQLTEAQAQKATAVNHATDALAKALADTYSLDTSSAVTPGANVTIPYDTTNDLSERTALRYVLLKLAAGATQSFNAIHPAVKHLFFCTNNTTQTATVKTPSGTGISIAAGATKLLYCDGTNITTLTATPASILVPGDVSFNFYGAPAGDEVIASMLTGREIVFPANFSASKGAVTVNPTSSVTLTVKDDGVTIGTIGISSGGVVSFTTSGGTSKTVATGSLLTVEMQGSPDATLSGIMVVLLATIAMAQ